MNYDEMSDFEINKAVAARHGIDLSGITEEMSHWYDVPDYCNDPADAWPIIESNGISLINLRSGTINSVWLACYRVRFETICMSPDGSDNGVSCMDADFETYHTNPLRCAMICFLKMKSV